MTSSSPKAPSVQETLAIIEGIFTDHGQQNYLGEDVTMAEHMMQAAHMAERQGGDDLTVVAALLHDIGHFTSAFGTFSMDDTEDRYHEDAGAEVLTGLFPDAVVAAVQHHVAAKRYLCATDPDYYDGLSDASRHSLRLQGGPMDADEVKAFAQNPHLERILTVRRCDDGGKVAGQDTPDLAHFMTAVERVLNDFHAHRAATS